jgi:hypothetical protein
MVLFRRQFTTGRNILIIASKYEINALQEIIVDVQQLFHKVGEAIKFL